MKRAFFKKPVFLLALLAGLMLISFSAGAAGIKTKAKQAYKKYLKGKGYSTYAFIYFDNDSIPEMAAYKAGAPALFTYKNGKVTAFKNSKPGQSFRILGYYKKKGCLVQECESSGDYPHTFTTTWWTKKGTALYNKLQKQEQRDGDGTVQSAAYSWNKKKSAKTGMGVKKLSEKNFLKKLSKITGGKKMYTIRWKTWSDASISLNKSTAVITEGKSFRLKATVKGDSDVVTWTSDNKKVATVSSKGKVKGKKAGMATITAEANGVKTSCIVSVEAAITVPASELYAPVAEKYLGEYALTMYLCDLNSDGIMEMMVSNLNLTEDAPGPDTVYTDGLGKARTYKGPMDVYSIKDNKVVYINSVEDVIITRNKNAVWKISVGSFDIFHIYGMSKYKLELLETYEYSVDETSEKYKRYYDFVTDQSKEYEKIRAKAELYTAEEITAFFKTWLED